RVECSPSTTISPPEPMLSGERRAINLLYLSQPACPVAESRPSILRAQMPRLPFEGGSPAGGGLPGSGVWRLRQLPHARRNRYQSLDVCESLDRNLSTRRAAEARSPREMMMKLENKIAIVTGGGRG